MLSPPPSSGYVKVFLSERARLRGLEGWIKDLHCELLARASHIGAWSRTTYDELQEAVTPAPVRGRRVFTPSWDQVRRAVRTLVELGLLEVDRSAGDRQKVLIFKMPSRSVDKSAHDLNSPVNSPVGFQRETAANSPVNSPLSHKVVSLLKRIRSVDKSAASVDKLVPMPEYVRELQRRLHAEDGHGASEQESALSDGAGASEAAGASRVHQSAGEAATATAAGGAVSVAPGAGLPIAGAARRAAVGPAGAAVVRYRKPRSEE